MDYSLVGDDAFRQLNALMSSKEKPTSRKQNLFGEFKRGAGLKETDSRNLRKLTPAKLEKLLETQKKLSGSPIMKALPDGGAKVFQKIKEIEEALKFVENRMEEEIGAVGMQFNSLEIGGSADNKEAVASPQRATPQVATQMHVTCHEATNRFLASYYKENHQAKHRVRPPPTFISLQESAAIQRESREAWNALELEERQCITDSTVWKRPAFSEYRDEPPPDDTDEEDKEEEEDDDEDTEEEADDFDEVD